MTRIDHIGVWVRDLDAVAAKLRAGGHAILDGPRRAGDGYYECVVCDPEGNRVEIAAQ